MFARFVRELRLTSLEIAPNMACLFVATTPGDDTMPLRVIIYDEQMVHRCIELALQARPRGNTAVGSLVVVNGYIERNRGETRGSPLIHAARVGRIAASDRVYPTSYEPEPVKGGGTND